MSILSSPFETRSLENPNVPITAYQLSDIWGGGPTRAGVQVNEKTALTYMAVYTAVKIIAESLGNLPLRVYRQVNNDSIEVVRDRRESYMVGRAPNDEQTPAVFKECVQAWQCLWGNGYARILDARSTMQMIPLRSDRVKPERKAGKLVYTVEAVPGQGSAQTFDAAEILHLPGLSMNGVTGLSPVGVAREAIATGKAQEIFSGSFYGNGTNLGGALTHPGKLKPESRAGILARWNNAHQGVANSHKIAVLDEGVKFEPIGMALVDAQFLESRKFQVIEIARLYRVPPHMLMDLDRSTNNNIEQQSLEFLQYCLGSWLTKWEEELTKKIFGAGSDLFIAFDLTKLLMADLAAQQAFFASGRQWGYLSVNDVRRRLGLNPIPGGDIYLTPQNMMPSDKAHPLIDSQIAKNVMPPKAAVEVNPQKSGGESDNVGLNGAQITAAVDIIGKLRSGTIAGEAGTVLLEALGIEEAKAKAIVKATPAAGNSQSDQDFLRELLKSLAANPQTTSLIANSLNLGDVAKGAGAPQNTEYNEPYLPVTAAPGNMVSGGTIKDAAGSIVGGDVVEEDPVDPEPKDPELKPPEGGTTNEEKARKLAERLFTQAMRRMMRKEVNAIRKAAEKPEGFAVAAGKFYGEHREHLVEAIEEQAAAVAELLGAPVEVGGVVARLFAGASIEARQAAVLQMKAGAIEGGMRTHEETYPGWAGKVLADELMAALKKGR